MRFDGLLRVKAMGTLPHTSGRPVAAIQERHFPEEVPRRGAWVQLVTYLVRYFTDWIFERGSSSFESWPQLPRAQCF